MNPKPRLLSNHLTFPLVITYSMFFLPWWVGDPARTLPPKAPYNTLPPQTVTFSTLGSLQPMSRAVLHRKWQNFHGQYTFHRTASACLRANTSRAIRLDPPHLLIA